MSYYPTGHSAGWGLPRKPEYTHVEHRHYDHSPATYTQDGSPSMEHHSSPSAPAVFTEGESSDTSPQESAEDANEGHESSENHASDTMPATSAEDECSTAAAPAAITEDESSPTTPATTAEEGCATPPPAASYLTAGTVAKWLVTAVILRDCLLRLASRSVEVPSNQWVLTLGTSLLTVSSSIGRFVLAVCTHMFFSLCTATMQILWLIEVAFQARRDFVRGESHTTFVDTCIDMACGGVISSALLLGALQLVRSELVQAIYQATVKTSANCFSGTREFLRIVRRPAVLNPLLLKCLVSLLVWSAVSEVTFSLLSTGYQSCAALVSGIAFSHTLMLLVFGTLPKRRDEEESKAVVSVHEVVAEIFLTPAYWVIVGVVVWMMSVGVGLVMNGGNLAGASTPRHSYMQLAGFLTHAVSVFFINVVHEFFVVTSSRRGPQ